jgi:muramoyltetrapeptide carboxypeptidase
LAGTDAARARAVIDAFTDETTSAVICGKGGYGCTRILPLLTGKIPIAALKRKRFFGFSDATALHR